jgi:hypothetical protein
MRAGLVAGLAVMLAGSASAQSPREWTEDEQAVIDAASTGPVNIHEDFAGWEAGYHADWSIWRLGNDTVRDRDPHMDLVRDFVGSGAVVESFALEPVDVLVRGDVALLRYNAVETIRNADGEVREVTFSSATVFVREGGEWLALASNLSPVSD